MISRRRFLSASFAVGTASLVAGGAIANGSQITTLDLGLSRTEIFLPTLTDAFDGFSIGVLSDPHLGICSNNHLLTRAVDLLADEKIDLLILAGDYILILDLVTSRYFFNRYSLSSQQQSCSDKRPTFEDALQMGEQFFHQAALEFIRLNATYGIMAVLGNHDRWNSAENCCRIFEKSGIEMLVNRAITISKAGQSLEIYGSDDYGTGIPQPPPRSNTTRIMVSHNPDFLSELAKDNLFALGLAGHTHGGQINLPFVGPIALNIANHDLIQGLIRTGLSQILVSRGIGISALPWRINCPPEVNLITLRAGMPPQNA